MLLENQTILVVDDQTLNLQLLKNVLIEYTVTLAETGEKALKMLEKDNLPDLILLDIIMPGMNGHEIIKIIKENDRTRNIPVIFITGLDSVEDEEEGFNLGAVDYIVKPFNPAIVRARVRNTLRFRNQQKLLEKMAHIDALTEIPNRRNFNLTLEKEFKSALRNKKWLTHIMIDVDQFKHYNDSYGHAKGDEVLVEIAKTMQSCLKRPCDFLARYGGEEFAVILPDTDGAAERKVAETIRQTVNTINIKHQKPQGDSWITISLGGHSLMPVQNSDLYLLLEKADACLYRAKNNGRNCVVWED